MHATTPWLNQQNASSDRFRQKIIALLAEDKDGLANTAERRMKETETRIRHLQRIKTSCLTRARDLYPGEVFYEMQFLHHSMQCDP